ncbi:phosphomethylpyrimidine synthase ThiC [Meiothermus taiwanensis]|jgi:phosphomethylpyrimidine synthase|uniref:Phosphomethylpyrimidine synthase n=2 Tax=Meiothermus taiwanensis TaxID=172827 RepID=A0A399E2U1_9DEIN|nr:phosphomethylpyrimidine synthase ThiC [Meiothermus taiwanensis]AWR86185.1 thiamine biosynthesis protein ThiC [Meiothermus taiwanensis WR-220]KIQ54120.1 phosphomethylpyrimidine synthase [Meiothermus taiwanensis]KZK14789.1 phosphomethylpyrimidine synthase [Meiothermus taiwanensis]RIH77679.1 Phosphomethylpyrimidine synthase [Meiothermus taiwanensis]
MTQLEAARKGIVTEAMAYVAQSEGLEPEFVRERVAAGRVVIPANPNHRTLTHFTAIGEGMRVKVNANLGTSYDFVDPEQEVQKVRAAIEAGADAVMDLSTGGDLAQIRKMTLEASSVPLGTVPIYEAEFRAARRKSVFDMTPDELLTVIEEHGRSGVDYITIHAGVTQESLRRYRNSSRVTGIVSRGGGLLAAWMLRNERENPLWERFDDVLEIARTYDMTLSLGDGLRPGSLADATDRPQIQELLLVGELVERAHRAGVQVMVEGPGHIPLNEIQTNVQIQKKLTNHAPFYILGMLPVDTAAGYDHIAGAIGGAVAGWHGADMLCYLTPAEHLGLPTVQQVREGVIAFKIAAHAADVARGHPGALLRNRQMSQARYALDWERQFELCLFPQEARRLYETRATRTKACSMCGPFCPMNLVEAVLRGQARARDLEPA